MACNADKSSNYSVMHTALQVTVLYRLPATSDHTSHKQLAPDYDSQGSGYSQG